MLQGPAQTIQAARRLRRSMSLPEVLLWRVLRQQRACKFRRQHPAGPYVADFYCHEARLIIEIDGEAHNRGNRPQRDEERDAWFRARGLMIIHLSAQLILDDPVAAADAILCTATPLQSPAHAARGAERRCGAA